MVLSCSVPGDDSNTHTSTNANGIPVYTYEIVDVYPHDSLAYTQGLVFVDGVLYEGTGLRGQSSLRKVDLESGNVTQIRRLPARYFGEGIVVFGERIVQLTWESGTGFIYNRVSFELLGEFDYTTEGWGITHDGEHLIMSDGTATIYFWNKETFEQTGNITVYDNNGPVVSLNELEYIEGEIYANIWGTDRIARIDPKTGEVVGWIDLKGLLTAEYHDKPVDVLNGIAYDAEGGRLFVTGKLWPALFEIKLVERS